MIYLIELLLLTPSPHEVTGLHTISVERHAHPHGGQIQLPILFCQIGLLSIELLAHAQTHFWRSL
jgi:hypothetical protein